MKKILIFKTSSDPTMFQLLEELEGEEVYCLIQTSQMARYQDKYNSIHFIDIKGEGFYDLQSSVLDRITNNVYDEVFITFSGVVGHNYGNVIEILRNVRFRKGYFYNCKRERVNIPNPNTFKDFLCRAYITLIRLLY